MLAQALDVATRAVIVRERGDWVAIASGKGRLVRVARSTLAAPLVRALQARGYSVRFRFPWHGMSGSG